MSLHLLTSLAGEIAAVEDWRGERGLWLGASTALAGEWPDEGLLLLSGNFWEGMDQITRARAACGGRPVQIASDVNPDGRVGMWHLAIALEGVPSGEPIVLELPYAVNRGIFATGARYLKWQEARVEARLHLVAGPPD